MSIFILDPEDRQQFKRQLFMPIKILLSSSLRNYFPEYNPAEGIKIEPEGKITVGEVCRKINVPAGQIKIIMVNGRNADFSKVLEGDERVGLFPSIGGG